MSQCSLMLAPCSAHHGIVTNDRCHFGLSALQLAANPARCPLWYIFVADQQTPNSDQYFCRSRQRLERASGSLSARQQYPLGKTSMHCRDCQGCPRPGSSAPSSPLPRIPRCSVAVRVGGARRVRERNRLRPRQCLPQNGASSPNLGQFGEQTEVRRRLSVDAWHPLDEPLDWQVRGGVVRQQWRVDSKLAPPLLRIVASAGGGVNDLFASSLAGCGAGHRGRYPVPASDCAGRPTIGFEGYDIQFFAFDLRQNIRLAIFIGPP